MTRETFGAILSIVSLMASLALIVDMNWFYRDRLIQRMLKKCKREGRCILCKRPVVIDEDEA